MTRCGRPVITRILIAAGPERRAHVRHQRTICNQPHGHAGPHMHTAPVVLEGAGAVGYSVGHPSTGAEPIIPRPPSPSMEVE